MSFCFEIKGLTKMANPSGAKSTHWRYAHAESKKWHALVAEAIREKKPKIPFDFVMLSFVRHSSVCPDYDGLVIGFKRISDALVKCGVMKDDKMITTGKWNCDWEKAPKGKGKIQVRVNGYYSEGL